MSPSLCRLLALAGCTAVGAAVALLLRAELSAPEENAPAPVRGDAPGAERAVAPGFVLGPYLQFPTRESMTIMWETAKPGTSVVEYATGVPLTHKVEENKDATVHEVTLTGLKPGTKYVYRVTTTAADGTTVTSEPFQFLTAPDEDAAFSFGIIGDTQKNPTVTGQIAKLIWERRPHFVIHCGDVVDNGPDKKEWEDELFGPCHDLFARVAVLPTIGNHERNHAWYYRYFALPKPKYYYRFRYGNADFFVIDSNKSLKPESNQYQWLDGELARSDAKWKFVYHHHPAWSSDDNDYGNTWRGPGTFGDMNVRNLVGLYEKHNVDVVFNGHVHLYERTWPLRSGKIDRERGVIYLTSGGGGGKLDDVGPVPAWFKAQVRVDFHFCYVNIQGGQFELKAFDQRGCLFDCLDLKK